MNTLFETSKTDYKDEWLTPPSIIKSIASFDLDPCSPVTRPWETAKHHFTINDNGLIQSWFGLVWCNPPYSNVSDWLKKCAYYQNCIALTFARTETEYFFKYVWNKAHSIFFFHKRISFLDIHGIHAKYHAGAPSVLIAYNEETTQLLADSSLQGKHLLIKEPSIIVVGISPTWFCVITIAINNIKDDSELKPLYEMVERIAPDKIQNNQHWKAKVRQQLYVYRSKKINTFNNL